MMYNICTDTYRHTHNMHTYRYTIHTHICIQYTNIQKKTHNQTHTICAHSQTHSIHTLVYIHTYRNHTYTQRHTQTGSAHTYLHIHTHQHTLTHTQRHTCIHTHTLSHTHRTVTSGNLILQDSATYTHYIFINTDRLNAIRTKCIDIHMHTFSLKHWITFENKGSCIHESGVVSVRVCVKMPRKRFMRCEDAGSQT